MLGSPSMWSRRNETRIQHDVELADKIEPYEFPFLGILPRASGGSENPSGVIVRYVFPDSPAEAAGIKPGDRIAAFAGQAADSPTVMALKLQTLVSDEQVPIQLRRGDETLLVSDEAGPAARKPARRIAAGPCQRSAPRGRASRDRSSQIARSRIRKRVPGLRTRQLRSSAAIRSDCLAARARRVQGRRADRALEAAVRPIRFHPAGSQIG